MSATRSRYHRRRAQAYCREARFWWCRTTSTPKPSYKRRRIDSLWLRGCAKLKLLTTKWDLLFVYAVEQQGLANINIVKSGHTLNAAFVPSWTANLGYKGDGTTQYQDPIYNTGADLVLPSLNSVTMWFYLMDTVSQARAEMGVNNGANLLQIVTQSGSTAFSPRLNQTTTPSYVGFGTTIGAILSTRRDATQVFGYQNQVAKGALAAASSAIPVGQLVFMARYSGGSPGLFSSKRHGADAFGAGMTDAEALTWNAWFEWYFDKLGIGVA